MTGEPAYTVVLPLSAEERAVLDDMRATGLFQTDVDLLRVALWRFTLHLGVSCPTGSFLLGQQRDLFDDTSEAAS